MSKPSAPKASKLRLRLRFGLRGFVVVVILLCVALAIVTQRARQQKRVCQKMTDAHLSYEFCDPPWWVQFLPRSLLSIDDGHWCHTVEKVSLRFDVEQQTNEQICQSLESKLHLVSGLPRLNRLEIVSRTFTNNPPALREVLSGIKDISGLKSLVVQTDQISDVLESLPELTYLRDLALRDWVWGAYHGAVHVHSKVELACVSKFPRLESLELTSAIAAKEDLSPLAKLAHLKEVRMYEQCISEPIIKCLAKHPRLESLAFARASYTDDVLRTFATCPNLKSVDASGSLITDRGLSYLANVPYLETLSISHTSVSDAGFASLANCKMLKSLVCYNCRLSDAIGPTLKKLNKLKKLSISKTLATTNLLKDLQTLTRLEHIDFESNYTDLGHVLGFMQNRSPSVLETPPLWGSIVYQFGKTPGVFHSDGRVDLTGVRGISGQLSRLGNAPGASALLIGKTDISDSDMKDIAAMPNLLNLDISDTSVGAQALSELSKLQKLQTLKLGPFENLDDVLVIISKIPSLENLTILGGQDIKEVGQDALASMSGLRSLEIPNIVIGERFQLKLERIPELTDIQSANLRLEYSNYFQPLLRNIRNSLTSAIELKKYLAREMLVFDALILDSSELNSFDTENLTRLYCTNVKLSHDAIAKIAKAEDIHELDLSNTGIVDQDLAALSKLQELQWLNLSGNAITDESVDTLLSFAELQELSLANTRVTNAVVARILNANQLKELDLSGTAVTDIAWAGMSQRSPIEMKIKLVNVPGLPSILANVPLDCLSNETVIEENGFALNRGELDEMRHHRERASMETVAISPALLGFWPFEEVLKGKSFIGRLRINQTGQVRDVLNLLRQVPVNSIEITGETFNSTAGIDFPETVRRIELKDCVIKTPILEAMTRCQWLRAVKLSNCDLYDCSLEPLARIPMLCTLMIQGTATSVSQRNLLDGLRSKLGNSDWDQTESNIPW